ncbi:hemocytin [Drosophila guanche]|uniref:Blast:Hemocytin n=1 Tax=Drosophila guanche TaxID=7266 RepID=A0A3B0JUG4_DROGU|nr:hemocytin [Drosophila guanche]SPP76371.1 blast:Hemocytin [Drosophila guanche]
MTGKVIYVSLWLLLISHVWAEEGDLVMNDEDDEDINPLVQAVPDAVDNEVGRDERHISFSLRNAPAVSTRYSYAGSGGGGVGAGYGAGIKTSANAGGYGGALVNKLFGVFGKGNQGNFYGHGGQSLAAYGKCSVLELPPNVQSECHNGRCKVSCPAGYSFGQDIHLLEMFCSNDGWIIGNSIFSAVPPCQALCQPACQNNGICISAGVCQCPENYFGVACQQKKSVCASFPKAPKNSKVSCKNNVCHAECMRGFQFPDGSGITNIECRDGQWVHTKTGLSKPPDCGPTCAPACENGGQCISFNVCQCSKMFRGAHCQYNIATCNVTNTNFNGNYKCAYEMEEARCTFNCPQVPGLKVQGRLDIEYKCNYQRGQYLPAPLPRCIFPPGYTIRSSTSTQKVTQQAGRVYHGGFSGEMAYEIRTEREKLLALLAKYRDMERRSEWWSSEETVVTPGRYSLYQSNELDVVIDKTPRPALCTTWGGINMKTFDGLVFKAPLSCSHTLITDKVSGTFDIILKACPYGSGYGCAHTLKVLWQSVLYTFENLNGTIQLSTPIKKLPMSVQVMGMKVMPVAQHVQIDLESVGLKLDWDHHQYVSVQAGPQMWGKVGGLCGSLDGDPNTDFVSRTGKKLETVKAFADAWRVQDHSEMCLVENGAELDFGMESCEQSKLQKAVSVCERLLANEKLGDCIKPFNYEALIRTCMADYCNCANREHPESCNCDAIAMLAKECGFKGIKLEHGWRNLEICPISCGFGRVYQACGPNVEPTCDSDVALSPTRDTCNEGCFCPEGTVQYKDACITRELCPCTLRGKEFKPESTVKKNCNTCTCKNGQWRCTDDKCGARCGAIGDPHYQTFDGKRYDFMGKCSYHLLKTQNMSVEAENVPCSGAVSEAMNFVAPDDPSCTKSVTIRFVLRDGTPSIIKLDQGLTTIINDKPIAKLPKMLGLGEVLIRRASSTFLTVEFADGIRVWWDGVSRVYIDAPPSWRGQTQGLCGTFNSNTQDDFLTPEGDVETAVEPFADKWRTKDTCQFKAETHQGPHPCTLNPERKTQAEKHCDWILQDIFQDCHFMVEPEQFYEDCLYDTCACKDELSKCFCPILSAYGTECMRQGVKTGWRMTVKECAVKCPMGQIFDECGDGCALTCDDLPSKGSCNRECVEGCRCPHGEYINDQGECVPKQKCHCSFDGMSFRPGYKEVRPGEKFLDLCTCQDGVWDCQDAEPGDKDKYPPSSELRSKCSKQPFAEFTKCAPKEPKTCKNMDQYVADSSECLPGCVCMKGYVYDTSRLSCVLPTNCSCHHAGKSYDDGEKIKEDCNLCVCQAGNWKCSENGCESTCSVWGDSHFTTFDGHDFDFQGACDYVLAKGAFENGDGFSITIQNVLCGTMGVTCSKSLEISLTGHAQESLVLSADSAYSTDPNKTPIKKLRDSVNSKGHNAFHIYKAGVFVIVEVIPLKLQVKWDEGTRVYVKLGNEWRHKVSGLCGNYNGNGLDDMQTPSLGLETSPMLFGHAWKLQPHCSAPVAPIDACKAHPERETWAQLKCGALKSELFAQCHSEVPLERYWKRCIFDTCACDQGGDCECLCTAMSAYADACAQKGINIRWRSQHFCPMQCDPHCSDYKSCTPACAVETCDNFLDQGIAERMCNRENCLEGCHIKPCDDGFIYLNDTYRECVPKAECKPVCMVRDGKTYYEGDVTYTDSCATCRCSKRKEICSGVKCNQPTPTTPAHSAPLVEGTTEAMPLATQNQTKCVKGWTRWCDKDKDASDKSVRLNDEEKVPRYDRLENVYGTCLKEYMTKVECRVKDTHEAPEQMDENVVCNLEEGLRCTGKCHDYELRAFCQCEQEPLPPAPKPTERPQIGLSCDAGVVEYKDFPGDCHKFLHCQPKGVEGGWIYVEQTCGEYMMFNPTMFICDHIATVQELKPSCGKKPKPEPELEPIKQCPEGKVWTDCANQCEHTCHYYGSILRKRGLCQPGEHCKPGCVDQQRPDCHQLGKYWRDEDTCVHADECPCMDKAEHYVQPHKPVFGEFEVCQCIDNAFTCVPNKPDPIPEQPIEGVPEVEPLVPIYPVTLTPPLHCASDRLVPKIENGPHSVPDSIFNASSQLAPEYGPTKARLTKQHPRGSWSPNINDQMQYLELNFGRPEPFYGVVMAGSPDFDNYVTLFKILHSHDGIAYHYLVDETEKPQMFNGPLDSRAPVQTLFKIPIEASSLRIYPLKWHGSIAMRVELLVCGDKEEPKPTVSIPPTSTEHPAHLQEMECIDQMGVDEGKMYADQVQSSSIWRLPKPAKKPALLDLLKLSTPLSWRPLSNTPNEFVEFDFLEPRNISGFLTKGGPDGWVTGYKVLFSKKKPTWNTVLSPSGQPRIFEANVDGDTERRHHFKTPILTQFLKVVPAKWERNINMRIEPLGCFKPYPEIQRQVPVEDSAPTKCNICDGIAGPQSSASDCPCHSQPSLFWDGNSCVQHNLCPCVENYVSYPIGNKFENSACEECVCVLGGHKNCKPKKCEPCQDAKLRPVITSDCFCKCEPCPKQQRLCPSSGDCIPEVLWCNGVQDCTDDEDSSCSDSFTVQPDIKREKNETEIITCPAPVCPPQMKIKIIEKKARKMSKMFTFSKQVSILDDGVTITKTKFVSSKEQILSMPTQELDFQLEEHCDEFTCVPIPSKLVDKNETVTCTEPKCPEKYDVELDMSTSKAGDCLKYTCVLRPNKDDVCEISGKSFTSFDGTLFKYGPCSHILARDIHNGSWSISVHQQCTDESRKICHKVITIQDIQAGNELILLPHLKLKFNGFEFTVQQLINSPICKASFVVSQPGKTLLAVSTKYGFWVQLDDIGIVKVGISSKFIRTVDGLCGYYNGNPRDDKRSPEGQIIANTEKFGDSWYDKRVPKEQCGDLKCSRQMQAKALQLCNIIHHPTFARCHKAVNYKQFLNNYCLEAACDCMMANGGDPAACKCNILESFVKKCLSVNPLVQLSTWRAVAQCEISCPSPLVHTDCYKRRCEPSCDNIHGDDCPVLPDTCFPGCYCPEGSVRKGPNCVPISECKDCVCNAMGASNYMTYDRKSFSFNGNCTYLLSRDVVLPGVHTFQVYVSMDDCKKLGQSSPVEGGSCAKSLHILNGDHVIHVQRVPQKPKSLQVLVDGFEVKRMPYKDSWISLRQVVGKELVLSLPESHVELTASFEDLIFSLGVPSIKYGSKMEGLCGDCNGNAANDLQPNPARKKPGVDAIQSWQADEPKLGLTDAQECLSEDVPKEQCIPLPPEKDPCLQFYNAELFGKCPLVVDPIAYVSACQQDICKPGNTQQGVCVALAAYAKECNQHGICTTWRRPRLCPYECPSDMVYEPCGCAKSCDTIKAMSEYDAVSLKSQTVIQTVKSDEMCISSERFEGCFCPPGQVMDAGKCVPEIACSKCDDGLHLPGEKWPKDKCTDCQCDENGKTSCVQKKCQVEENICAEDYKPQIIVTKEECCPRYRCVPEPKDPAKLCLAPMMPVCGPGQFKKQKNDVNGCPQYICECKPKEECEVLKPPRELLPGEKLVKIEEGCCPTQKIVCQTELCPKAPISCPERFYEVKTTKEVDACCSTHSCVPPKNLCIVQYELDDSSKFTKQVGEKWTHAKDVCKRETCSYGPDGNAQVLSTLELCSTDCAPGFSYQSVDKSKCCGKCIQSSCVFEQKLYGVNDQWKSADNCTLYSCLKKDNQLMVTSSKEICPDVTGCLSHLLYQEGCCKRCKLEPMVEDKSTCLPVSLAESQTKEILKFPKSGHGICVNAEPIKGFTDCQGACSSGSKYNRITDMHEKFCTCCSIKSYQPISVKMVCQDGHTYSQRHEVPANCGCSPCSEISDPPIDVRMQPDVQYPLLQLLGNHQHN